MLDKPLFAYIVCSRGTYQIVNARNKLPGPPLRRPLPIETYSAVPIVPPIPISWMCRAFKRRWTVSLVREIESREPSLPYSGSSTSWLIVSTPPLDGRRCVTASLLLVASMLDECIVSCDKGDLMMEAKPVFNPVAGSMAQVVEQVVAVVWMPRGVQ